MHKDTISIITCTWMRPNLLLETIENIAEQDYPHELIEHIIVSEGEDLNLQGLLSEVDTDIRTLYYECGRNWSSFLPDSYCAAPVIMGTFAARGNYHTWWADDERMNPDHLTKLHKALQDNPEAGFSYSKCILYNLNDPLTRWEIGKPVPEHGEITNCMYRAETLRYGIYQPFVTRAGDWDVIKRWMRQGVKWAFVDETTMTHRNDNI